MNINIKKQDCKFYVSEETRTVVCVIENTQQRVYDFLQNDDPVNPFFDLIFRMSDKLEMPSRFTGKAVCSPDDEFDVEFGKDIAFHRAKHKYNTSFFKRAQTFINEVDWQLNQTINRINAYGEALAEGAERRAQRIEARLNGVPLPEEEVTEEE